MLVRSIIGYFDERLGSTPWIRRALAKSFPDHWSFMLGEITLYSFLILLATGTVLGLLYQPSGDMTVYHGPYRPLDGTTMSGAYLSTLRISFEMPGGLLLRQTHHWAAIAFIAAITLHAARIFFTGAFRKPREINWLVGTTLFLLGILMGFTGYSLPDDALSGAGLKIAQSIADAVPFVGTWGSWLVFGGDFPNPGIPGRLFIVHVWILPLAMTGLIAGHLGILWRQKHTQFRAPGRSEHNVVGSPLWPNYTLRSLALGAAVVAVYVALGAFVEINPVWQYGSYRPSAIAAPSQPDWFVGWLDGVLRLEPNWTIHVGPHLIGPQFWAGIFLPLALFGAMYAWPWIERRITGDAREHNLLDRPREVSWRTAVGIGALTFVLVTQIAGSLDIQALVFRIPIETLRTFYQASCFLAPVIAGFATWHITRELERRANERHTPGAVTLRRGESGGFEETIASETQ